MSPTANVTKKTMPCSHPSAISNSHSLTNTHVNSHHTSDSLVNHHSTNSPSDKIPRPLNCFLAYRLEKQSEIVARCPGANHRDISKIIAKWWKEASEEEKAPYRERARLAKLEHARLYPNYKYTPQKKACRKTRRYTIRPKNKFTSRSETNNRMMELFYQDRSVLENVSSASTPTLSAPSASLPTMVSHPTTIPAEPVSSPLSWPSTPDSVTSASFCYPAHPSHPPSLTNEPSPVCLASPPGSTTAHDDMYYPTMPVQHPPSIMIPMYGPQPVFSSAMTAASSPPTVVTTPVTPVFPCQPIDPSKMSQDFIDPNLLSSMMPLHFNHGGNVFYYDNMALRPY